MEIDLYSVCTGNAKKIETVKLKNQRLIHSIKPKIEIKDIGDLNVLKPKYKYEIDKSLKPLFKEKLNAKILYHDLNRESFEDASIAYTKLHWHQKIQISWQFGNCWIQKPNNIMWIINIIVAILAVIFAAKAIKN